MILPLMKFSILAGAKLMLYYVGSSRNKVYSLQICLHYTPCSRKTHEHSHKTWVYNPLETCVLEGDEHIRWLGYAFISIKKIAMHFFFSFYPPCPRRQVLGALVRLLFVAACAPHLNQDHQIL